MSSARDCPGEDLISKLPNHIIGRILSYMSLDDAVRTSILSRRWAWEYPWTNITTLSLGDKSTLRAIYPIDKTSFINFVCNLLHRLEASNINEFHLYLSEKYDPYIFNQLISLVSNEKLKLICLHSLHECNISCYPIFKCQSLERLLMSMGPSTIQFPSFVCLSSLTSLDLRYTKDAMSITCYPSNHSKELTLKFPVLREFNSYDCIWLAVKRVTIEAPLLEELKILRHYYMLSDVSKAAIEIRSCCIRKYTLWSYISSETILLNAAHVADASICLDYEPKLKKTRKQKKFFVSKIFNIKNLKCLRLEDLDPIEHYFADIPTFEKLGYLQLCYPETIENVVCLLLKSPCLETLVLEKPIYSDEEQMDSDEEQMDFATVPECFQSTLKVVRFEKFAGSEPELSFAKFVMEKSQFLESISFSCYEMQKSEIEKTKEKIFLFKRSFNIEFSVHLG